MAIAHVQTPNGASNSATSINVTLTSVAAGSCIVVGWRYSVGGRTVTLSDDKSNTYTSNAVESIDTADGNSTCGLGLALNVASGNTVVTFAISGGAQNLRMLVSEFSGVATSSALDKTAQANGSGTAINAGSVTPTTNGQLFYVVDHLDAAANPTAGTDFTIIGEVPASPTPSRLMVEYYVQPTAGAHNCNSTVGTSRTWGCAAITLKAPGAASTALKRNSSLSGLGSSGPFFHDPLAMQGAFAYSKRSRIFVPAHVGRGDLLERAA